MHAGPPIERGGGGLDVKRQCIFSVMPRRTTSALDGKKVPVWTPNDPNEVKGSEPQLAPTDLSAAGTPFCDCRCSATQIQTPPTR